MNLGVKLDGEDSKMIIISGETNFPWEEDQHHFLKWSVTEMVSFREPTGDLNMAGSGLAGDWTEMGQKAHKFVAKQLAEVFPVLESEKELNAEIYLPELNVTLALTGRADFYYQQNSGLFKNAVIEEIKSTITPKELAANILQENACHPYAEQALIYCYLLQRQAAESILARVRVVDIFDFNNQTTIGIDWTQESVEKIIYDRVKSWCMQHQRTLTKIKQRRLLSKTLEFPYQTFRQGQSSLIEKIQAALVQEKNLLIQAPTGIGKTSAIIYPAIINALASEEIVFFLVSKGTQVEAPIEFLKDLLKKEPTLKVTALSSKEKLCIAEKMDCRGEACEFASRYHDRKKSAELECEIKQQTVLSSRDFIRLGQKYKLCPYQLSRENALDSDMIIGDFNFLFSDSARLDTFFSKDSVIRNYFSYRVLIDEAHNLPQRLRDIYSFDLSTKEIEKLFQDIDFQYSKKKSLKISRAIDNWEKIKILLSKVDHIEKSRAELKTMLDDLCLEMSRLTRSVSSKSPMSVDDPLWVALQKFKRFCEGLSLDKERHLLALDSREGELNLHIYCLDPSLHGELAWSLVKPSLLFSATLLPFSHFMTELGLESTQTLVWEEGYPFDLNRRKLLIIPQASTKLRVRNRELPKIVEIIEKICSLKQGNYFVFFPSFQFLEQTYLQIDRTKFEIYAQKPQMSPHEVSEIICSFRSQKQPLLLFAVQGGIFSEGIDLPGKSLIGVIVVGPALSAATQEREATMRFYNKASPGNGYNRTYIYPAMAKSIQSAGRVIRRSEDYGLIVLIDDRFLEKSYQESFPKDWLGGNHQVSHRILSDIENFWTQHD